MKNDEKKEKKLLPKPKLNTESKKQTRKNTNNNQEEKNNKSNKNTQSIKTKIQNIHKITTGTTLFSDNNNININTNKKEINDSENSFEGKMFYEVNTKNKNNYVLNNPIKTINVYRNNYFNYTNNNLISNLLCDVSDDNKNVMVSELDLNISSSQTPTPRPDIAQQPPSKRLLEKQNTEIDFKSQLETNLIKILEKKMANNNNDNNENKNKIEKKNESFKENEENKNLNVIDLNKIDIPKDENKIKNLNTNKILLDAKKYPNNQTSINKYLSKVNSHDTKNKYLVSSAKTRKTRGLKSPNINVHKVNSIMSPSIKKYKSNKKTYWNNYTKTDICIKKYKTIIENSNNININNNINNNNNKNNNQINSVKFYNQIKSKNKKNKPSNQNTTSKKTIKSYIIYNHNLANNKLLCSNNNYRHCIYKLNAKSKSKNILLTNYSNNNLDLNINSNSINQNEKMNYSKYKNLLNELQKNLSRHFQQKEENSSKANSHRNKKNKTYLIFNLENSNGRKSIKKDEIFSSNTSNTINNKYNLNINLKSLNNISMNKIDNLNLNDNNEETNNNNNNTNNKNIIMINRSIDNNLNLNKKIDVKMTNFLTKQNSDINLLHEQDIMNKININNNSNKKTKNGKSSLYLKRPSKNNSCQLNQKFERILSDYSLININNNKSSNEKNKYKYNKNKGLYGIEQINLEINQKSNNSNIEISPKDYLNINNINNTKGEEKKEKEEKNNINLNLNYNNKTKKNSDFSIDKTPTHKISIKKNIMNKKINTNNNYNNYNYKYSTNSKSNNINNMNNNMITFRNKFIQQDISLKKNLSKSKDTKEKEKEKENKDSSVKYPINKLNKRYLNSNNNINFNYNYNYNHFSPTNKMNKKNIFSSTNHNNIKDKSKNSKKIIKDGNKVNIDINVNNNINYIYIIKTKKNRFKNKSNNHVCTMK